jgi:adenine-specific DNA-methyltransferase
MARKLSRKSVDSLKHKEATRKNIPTAEFESVLRPDEVKPVKLRYPRNTDLDPQLVWRGKDEQDWSDLVVHAPPLYIQEKVHPKVLIDDLLRTTKERAHEAGGVTARPIRRLQRHRQGGRQDRVLPARPELVEPHDPR